MTWTHVIKIIAQHSTHDDNHIFEAGKSPKFGLFVSFYKSVFEVSEPFYHALIPS